MGCITMCEYCDKLENEINEKHPDCNWNCDAACDMWNEKSVEIPDKGIVFEPFDDENYGCTCPNCGKLICGWCV